MDRGRANPGIQTNTPPPAYFRGGHGEGVGGHRNHTEDGHMTPGRMLIMAVILLILATIMQVMT